MLEPKRPMTLTGFGCSVHRLLVRDSRAALQRPSCAAGSALARPPVVAARAGPRTPREARSGSRSSARPRYSSGDAAAPETAFGFRDGLRPKQSLGQNFLRDAGVARRIVDAFADSVEALCPGVGGVVEVGAGTGALTRLLLDRYPRLHALDIDQRAVEYLRERMPELDVRHADVLDIDWRALAGAYGGSVAVIGNLPYNIVSQIMFALFEAPAPAVGMAVVMMQKEVADRIVAPIRTKSYGILSVVGQLYAKPETLFSVPPTVFSPRPSVDSALVRFQFIPHPDLDVYNTTLTSGLRSVLRSAFQQRRKTMRNSLRVLCDERNIELPEIWAPKRAEELAPPEFIELTRFIFARELENPRVTDRTRTRPDTVWRGAAEVDESSRQE